MIENGNKSDITEKRYHHEIYLSDPRERVMTNAKPIRISVRRISEQRRRHGQRRHVYRRSAIRKQYEHRNKIGIRIFLFYGYVGIVKKTGLYAGNRLVDPFYYILLPFKRFFPTTRIKRYRRRQA